jgi:hypothetical protein
VVLATLENVRVELAGMAPETIALGIDEEGLVVGPYGKVTWAGSQMSVHNPAPDSCTIQLRTATGAYCTFTIPNQSLGGALSAPAFGKWIQRGAAHSGATIVDLPAGANSIPA